MSVEQEIKDTKFQKGQSGNPDGRPKGSRNIASLLIENMLQNEAEDITNTLVKMAKSGDIQAIKLVVERLLPPLKEKPLQIDLETKNSSLVELSKSIITSTANGEVNSTQAKNLAYLIEAHNNNILVKDLENRIKNLEKHNENRNNAR